MEKLVLNAEDKNLDFVLASIRKSMETHNCSDEEAIMAVFVSAEEIYTNISHYAYPSGEDRSVEITVETSEHLCRITYKDSGIPYNPLEAEAPDISLDVMDMPVGGLGIFMVREMMDVITYRYKNEHNILTMEKRY